MNMRQIYNLELIKLLYKEIKLKYYPCKNLVTIPEFQGERILSIDGINLDILIGIPDKIVSEYKKISENEVIDLDIDCPAEYNKCKAIILNKLTKFVKVNPDYKGTKDK